MKARDRLDAADDAEETAADELRSLREAGADPDIVSEAAEFLALCVENSLGAWAAWEAACQAAKNAPRPA